MWLQIVGQVEMVSTSLINHWWNVWNRRAGVRIAVITSMPDGSHFSIA